MDDARESGKPFNNVLESLILHQFTNDVRNDLFKV